MSIYIKEQAYRQPRGKESPKGIVYAIVRALWKYLMICRICSLKTF